MKIALDPNHGKYSINFYEPGSIKVNQQLYSQSILITPEQLITDWPPQVIDDIKSEHFQQIIALNPEVVILGTGPKLIFPKPELLNLFYQQRIGIEIMDTRAASRTYNVLASENRNAIAALLIR